MFGRKFWRELLFAFGLLVVLIGAGYMYATGGRYVATENAYVQADIATISASVPGRIVAINVAENQRVEAGELLVELNQGLYQVAVDQAQAKLASVVSNVEVLRATYRQRRAEVQSAEQDIVFFTGEFQRQQGLIDRGMTSRSAHDAAEQELNEARAEARVARQGVAQVLAAFNGSIETPTEELAMYKGALAAVHEAELRLSYTLIEAPVSGIVGQISSIQLGDFAGPGVPLFVIVDTDHPWVEANFKETDLTYVVVGQSAHLRLDSYPDHEWQGRVGSISPASGAEFSLLPAQNSSGNWVKVVQRIPLRLDIEQQAAQPRLRAGMSVEVTIDTGHQRLDW